MTKKTLSFISMLIILSCNSDKEQASEDNNLLKLKLRQRIEHSDSYKMVLKDVSWNPKRTAVIIIDMWDKHHCTAANRRVAEMAPFMNKVVHAARTKGLFIIHAPSDCMDFYKDKKQREKAKKAIFKQAPVNFAWNNFNPDFEGPIPSVVAKSGCACDTPEPCSPGYKAWIRQNEAIEIATEDVISDDGQEIYNVLNQEDIENVIIMGVHTNMCILGRPFGIRQMKYLGMNTVLCRDLTDSYHRNPGKHFEGLAKIIEHIETYWCPTITSDQLTGLKPFVFRESK